MNNDDLIIFLNRVLGSDAVLSTDEGSSSEEASDLDELGKDLESMLSNKKNKHEVVKCLQLFTSSLFLTYALWLMRISRRKISAITNCFAYY